MGRSGDGSFIQPVVAADHQSTVDAQIAEHLCQWFHQLLIIDTQKLHGGSGRIGQRPQNVENGADSHFLADRSGIFHGRVVGLGEHEAHASIL